MKASMFNNRPAELRPTNATSKDRRVHHGHSGKEQGKQASSSLIRGAALHTQTHGRHPPNIVNDDKLYRRNGLRTGSTPASEILSSERAALQCSVLLADYSTVPAQVFKWQTMQLTVSPAAVFQFTGISGMQKATSVHAEPLGQWWSKSPSNKVHVHF